MSKTLQQAIEALEAAARALSDEHQRQAVSAVRDFLSGYGNPSLSLNALSITQKRKRKTVSDEERKNKMYQHIRSLKAAGTDRDAFETALNQLLSDKLIRVSELWLAAKEYAGTSPAKRATREHLEQHIREAFSSLVWDDQALKRIEGLTAAE